MNALYFVLGMLGAFVIVGIIVGISDYQELKDRVRNNREEIKKQEEVAKHRDRMVCEMRAEFAEMAEHIRTIEEMYAEDEATDE